MFVAGSAIFRRAGEIVRVFLRGNFLALRLTVLHNPAGLNYLTEKIIACAIAVHRFFGPGLLESVYRASLVIELRARGLRVEVERRVPLRYRDQFLGEWFRADLIVEGLVVVEVKALFALAPVHEAQLITYLKLTDCPVGLLLNFNVPTLKEGIVRRVRGS